VVTYVKCQQTLAIQQLIATEPYQTLVDNVGLLTPELLDKINQIIVMGGHALLKKGEGVLRGRCDSIVVETDVHFPSDINLLWDALRKAITLTAHCWCERQQLSDWRQYNYNLRQLKRLMRSAQNKKCSVAKARQDKIDAQVTQAYQVYIDQAKNHLYKIQDTLTKRAKLNAAAPTVSYSKRLKLNPELL
jgi:IS5 family transposase